MMYNNAANTEYRIILVLYNIILQIVSPYVLTSIQNTMTLKKRTK